MSTMDVFWILLMLAALQPVVRQKMLESARHRMIARIEQRRESRLILLVHRQETMRFLGFPMFRFIDINDSEQVIRAIHMTDDDVPIDMVLHTPGGLLLPSFQIARALHAHRAKVTVHVPFYAMSGGTLIALAADEIAMFAHSVLGPVDPQIGGVPAASVLRAVERKSPDAVEDDTLVLADQAERAIFQVRQGVRDLLADRYPEETVEELSRLLSEGTWTHDYAVTFDTARDLGLNVSHAVDPAILELMELFPQSVQRVPSVEYLPGPRVPRKSGKPVGGNGTVAW